MAIFSLRPSRFFGGGFLVCVLGELVGGIFGGTFFDRISMGFFGDDFLGGASFGSSFR